ncbi:hypothetical protein BaRGS_00011412, partial [Batillaria attramentaria]
EQFKRNDSQRKISIKSIERKSRQKGRQPPLHAAQRCGPVEHVARAVPSGCRSRSFAGSDTTTTLQPLRLPA